MKKLKQIIINFIINAILICIAFMVFYNLYYFFSGLEGTDYLLKTKDYVWVVSKDDMMSPYIEENDVIVFRDCKDEDLKKGDIVYIKESNAKKIAKIENIKTDNLGTNYYTTKGEKNYYYNQKDVTIKNIEGKFDKKVNNFIGNILKFAKSKIFSIIIVFVIISVFVIMERNYKKSIARKKKRESKIMKNKNSND